MTPMTVKRLTGSEGRRDLYSLAATTGEVVLALGGNREELQALAAAGAQRCGSGAPPGVVVIKDAAAFAASAHRLSWKRIPTQILIDGGTVDGAILDQIAERLSAVAPVIVATATPGEQVLE
jgi:hypothetical protein